MCHCWNGQMAAGGFSAKDKSSGWKPHTLLSFSTLPSCWFIRSHTRFTLCLLLSQNLWTRGRNAGSWTPTCSQNQSVSLHKTFKSSSGFDEKFPTSPSPHLPTLRCALVSHSFLESGINSSARAVIFKRCAISSIFNDTTTSIYNLNPPKTVIDNSFCTSLRRVQEEVRGSSLWQFHLLMSTHLFIFTFKELLGQAFLGTCKQQRSHPFLYFGLSIQDLLASSGSVRVIHFID